MARNRKTVQRQGDDVKPCRRCKTRIGSGHRDTTGLCRWCLRDDGVNLTGDWNAPEPLERTMRSASAPCRGESAK
jgi:ribosomal protein S14